MKQDELNEILEQHKLWITSMHERGSMADLRGAKLCEADLRGANLCEADLRRADLREADLRRADLRGANLCEADLRRADLRGANLCEADLRGADLRGANLCDADLCDADLRDADLCGADLCGADLCDADLRGVALPEHIFIVTGEDYFIQITNGEYIRAGCQSHSVEEWRKFSKEEIEEMDGERALKFYPRLLDYSDFYCGKGERPDWLNELSGITG